MKKLAMVIIIVFVTGIFDTAPAESDKKSGQDDAQKQQVAEPAKKPQPQPSQAEPWPRTFVPTEKIKADTVVSFPADI